MKLIDLVKRLPWPDGAAVVVQDCTVNGTGVLKYCRTDLVAQIKYIDEQRSMRWATNEPPVNFAASELADDNDEAIVTRADWLAAQDRVAPKEREPGFYWIADDDGEWVVAEWIGDYFWAGPTVIEPSEIDERRIVRQS